MTHLDPKRDVSTKKLREFAFLVGGAFVVLGVVSFLRHKPPLTYGSVAGLGTILLFVGAVAPRTLGPAYAGWMRFAGLLSKVTTPVFMGIVYFVLLTPTGVIMRLFGRNPLAAPRSDTSWVSRSVGERQSSMEHQF